MKSEMLILRTLFFAVLLTTALVFGSMLIPHDTSTRLAAGGASVTSASATLSLAVQGVCPVLADGVICPKAD